MSSWLAQHYLSGKVKHAMGVPDVYNEEVVTELPDGSVQKRKQKRELPQGISANDTKILKKLRRRAFWLELCFNIFGFNAGWTAVIGIVPFVGAAINLYLAYGTIKIASKLDDGINQWERSRLMGNVAVDFGLSFVPIIGDIAQAIYKANTRNVIFIENLLRSKATGLGEIRIPSRNRIPAAHS